MSGKKAILDTNIIIFASKGLLEMRDLLQPYEEIGVSIVSFMEVYGYEISTKAEQILIDEMFNNLSVIEVRRSIAEQVIIYRKNKLKKIKLPDAIILATAKMLKADLITDDWDDFIGIDESIKIIPIDAYRNDLIK
jgi:predicted nucleic acid-binding protein